MTGRAGGEGSRSATRVRGVRGVFGLATCPVRARPDAPGFETRPHRKRRRRRRAREPRHHGYLRTSRKKRLNGARRVREQRGRRVRMRGETHREIARARDARGAAEHGGASASGGGEHRVRSTAMVNERWWRQLSTNLLPRFRCLRGKSRKNRRVVRPSFRSTSVGPRHPALSGRVSSDQRVRAFSRRGSFS